MQFSFLTVVNIDKEGKKKRHGEIFVTDLLVDHLQTSATETKTNLVKCTQRGWLQDSSKTVMTSFFNDL